MKKFLFLLPVAALMLAVAPSCDDNDDNNDIVTITVKDLPPQAADFLTLHYGNDKVVRVVRDMDDNPLTYEVYFASGAEVEFDVKGEWVEINAPRGGEVPASVVPAGIAEYVKAHYQGQRIVQLSRELHGYDAELASGIDLEFDQNGNFLRIE